MVIRVSTSSLPADVAAALEQGETVEFERDGCVTAVARPSDASDGPSGLWEELWKLLVLDRDFEADIARLNDVTMPSEPEASELG
jgi:hypothetical protein